MSPSNPVRNTLHDELVSGRHEQRATLLVRPDNTIARRAYDSWGWQPVTRLKPTWDHAPTFIVLIKVLRRARQSPS